MSFNLLHWRRGFSTLLWCIVVPCTVAFVMQKPSITMKRALSMVAGAVPNGPWDASLRSPCKLNLFLRILGRRPNGYHDLASLFQAISFSDYMYFSKLPSGASKDEMICSDTSLAVDDSNLVIKALNLMRTKTGMTQQYFKVFLDKQVPMQAGLGGGSGNAATAMHAFNVLCGYPGTLEDLRLWSGDIGSDITFFFSTGTAYCTGRGGMYSIDIPYDHKTDIFSVCCIVGERDIHIHYVLFVHFTNTIDTNTETYSITLLSHTLTQSSSIRDCPSLGCIARLAKHGSTCIQTRRRLIHCLSLQNIAIRFYQQNDS